MTLGKQEKLTKQKAPSTAEFQEKKPTTQRTKVCISIQHYLEIRANFMRSEHKLSYIQRQQPFESHETLFTVCRLMKSCGTERFFFHILRTTLTNTQKQYYKSQPNIKAKTSVNPK